jgi:hypothetical protein
MRPKFESYQNQYGRKGDMADRKANFSEILTYHACMRATHATERCTHLVNGISVALKRLMCIVSVIVGSFANTASTTLFFHALHFVFCWL